jgi:hypothetical protein
VVERSWKSATASRSFAHQTLVIMNYESASITVCESLAHVRHHGDGGCELRQED